MTDHELRIRLAEAMDWTEIEENGYGDLVGMPPDDNCREPLPNPLEDDTDAAALEVWCVSTRPWCAGLTIIVDPARVEVCVDTYEGDPDAESAVIHRDTEPDPRRRRRSALCWAICRALDDPEAGGDP